MIIDTHIHLDHSDYLDDVDAVITRAMAQGITQFIIPATTKECLHRAIQLANDYEGVYFALGYHPHHIDEFDTSIFDQFMDHHKCVAIGECGLDYYYLPKEEVSKEAIIDGQKKVLIEHIHLAKMYNKPLIMHIREASEDTKAILLQHQAGEIGGVLHCFNGDESLLELAEHNFYFGIGGVLTFKNAQKMVDILPRIPQDRLLVETDAPYLTPHPHRGKRNESAYIPYIINKMAQLLNMNRHDLEALLLHNSQRLFDIAR